MFGDHLEGALEEEQRGDRKPLTNGVDNYNYRYTGLGDRIQQTVNGVTTTYILDLNTGLTQVLSDSTDTYLYGLSRIGEESTTWDYYLGDALGSVRQLTNDSGAVTLSQTYQPYGEVWSSYGNGDSSYSYTGEILDASGLVFLRSRYYALTTGRFLTKDVWKGNFYQPLSLNGWAYVEGDPINYSDPTGKCSVSGWKDQAGLFTEENCDKLEAGDLEFTEQWYYDFADYVEDTLPQTAKNMRHYLDGSGTELQLEASFMQDDIWGWGKIQNEVDDLIKWYISRKFNELTICDPTNFDPEIFARGFTPPYYQAHHLWPFSKAQLDISGSLGTFRLDVQISGSLHRPNWRRRVSPDLSVHLVVLDRYNWHGGLSVSYEGNRILDTWAGSLESAGLAKSYLVRGDLTLHVNNSYSAGWFGVGEDPPGNWVLASCIGSQFDIDQEGPGRVDYCGNPMRDE